MEWLKWFFNIIKGNFETTDSIPKVKFDENHLSHMTFNLRRDSLSDGEHRWEFRKRNIVTMLECIHPDILCVQECMPHMWKHLTQSLSNSYNWHSAELVGGKKLDDTLLFISEGLGILYNKEKFVLLDKGMFWLTDNPDRFGRSWGNKVPRICVWVKLFDKVTKETICVFNTHLDYESSTVRVKSISLIQQMARNVYGIPIICGDMNYDPQSEEHKFMSETYDCNYHHLEPASSKTTLNRFQYKPLTFIDFTYFQPQKSSSVVIETGFGTDFLSDHYPVLTFLY
jgi:endonuclease/exonuclease/phosphatase family metal-dependent hydrolase